MTALLSSAEELQLQLMSAVNRFVAFPQTSERDTKEIHTIKTSLLVLGQTWTHFCTHSVEELSGRAKQLGLPERLTLTRFLQPGVITSLHPSFGLQRSYVGDTLELCCQQSFTVAQHPLNALPAEVIVQTLRFLSKKIHERLHLSVHSRVPVLTLRAEHGLEIL